MGHNQYLALVETDQAALAAAEVALADLQRIGLILCYQRWSVDLAERYAEDIQEITTALGSIRKWLTTVRDNGNFESQQKATSRNSA